MDFDGGAMELLLEQHLCLADLFARHQAALVDRRWAEAARFLDEYERSLLAHMDFEERHLLPRCGAVDNPRWPGNVYRAEHRRIEQLMRRAVDRLRDAREREITPAMLVSLLDEERTLKHLVEHHHEREETALFPELRGMTSGAAAASAREQSAGTACSG